MFDQASCSPEAAPGRDSVHSATGKGSEMSRVRIGMTGATTVSRLLSDISARRGLADDLREYATYWAPAVQRKMDRRDVEVVASLLRSASVARGFPTAKREKAHYWAGYLESRM
jgi:hypothetical protein